MTFNDWEASEAEWWLYWWNEQVVSELAVQCAMSCENSFQDFLDALYTTYKFSDGSSLKLYGEGVAGISY